MRTRKKQVPSDVEAQSFINIKDKEGFHVEEVGNKGRGVITDKAFQKGEFLLQYHGKLCSWEEGDRLEEENSTGFRFFFLFKSKGYCIDATEEPAEIEPCLGRLVNHGEKNEINAKLKVIPDNKGQPALCLFAHRDIIAGEELLYDYGIKDLPWKVPSKKNDPLKPPEKNKKVVMGKHADSSERLSMTSEYSEAAGNGLANCMSATEDLSRELTHTSTRESISDPSKSPEENHEGMRVNDHGDQLLEKVCTSQENSEATECNSIAYETGTEENLSSLPKVPPNERTSCQEFPENNEGMVVNDQGDQLSEKICSSQITSAVTGCNSKVYETGTEENLSSLSKVPPKECTSGATFPENNEGMIVNDHGDQPSEREYSSQENFEGTECNSKAHKTGTDENLSSLKKVPPKECTSGPTFPENNEDIIVNDHGDQSSERICSSQENSEGAGCNSNAYETGTDQNLSQLAEVPPNVCANRSNFPEKDEAVLGKQAESSERLCMSAAEDLLGKLTQMSPRESISDPSKSPEENHEGGGSSNRLQTSCENSAETECSPTLCVTATGMSENSDTESQTHIGPTAREAWDSDDYSSGSDDDSSDSSEESYVPETDDEGSDHSEVIPLFHRPSPKLRKGKDIPGCSKEVSNEDWSETKGATESAVTNDVYVMRTHNTADSRCYDKPAYCHVCYVPQKKLIVHIKQHSEDPLVAQWLAAKGKEKEKLWVKIRNFGNHVHNYGVLEKGEGDLVVVYRPKGYANPSDYQPCVNCLGYYSCNEFYRHRCKLREESSARELDSGKKRRRSHLKESRLLLPPPQGCTAGEIVHRLLETLRSDDISRVIKGDQMILQLAKKLCFRHGHDKEQFNTLRTKLRQVSRLVLEYRLITGNNAGSLEDMITPSQFCNVVAAVRKLSGFDDDKHNYTKPSLALKLGHTLKKVAMMLVSEALIEGSTDKERLARDFHTLLKENWETEVSSHALRTLYQGKRNNPKLIPLTSDVIMLTRYLREEIGKNMKTLTDAEEAVARENAWKDLSAATVTLLMLFNRKRQGEISKMSLEDYSHVERGVSHVLDVQTLSQFEQDLVKVIWRVEIVGKRGRTVPVLITDKMKGALDELVKFRSVVGVNSTNQFMFPVLCSDHHIRGCDTLRTYSSLCGAKRPDLLRSTQLRKHIAVMSQVMALTENELDVVANFLGHDVRIHREYYRLPDPAIQVAKVAKLLVALEGDGGNPGEIIKGKTLDQLQLHEDEEIDQDANCGSDEDETAESEGDMTDELSQDLPENLGGKRTHDDDQHQREDAKKRCKELPDEPTKRVWSESEKAAVLRHFSNHIHLHKLPRKEAIEKCLAQEPCLRRRTWKNIKDFVRNKITSNARKTER
ncbi:N-lysine methyltransferase KMT5A-B [Holothuria leucospilota]|uniref:N-lysine methyltransferase KMT5A-B n=1 Tax=Holothuria leucospilota TaxID=206669 RepID=A0A9Q0YIJ1_HOLLE|nr:N-lysine methyltransferase KMT5A-B [Holothuria leucospilota]